MRGAPFPRNITQGVIDNFIIRGQSQRSVRASLRDHQSPVTYQSPFPAINVKGGYHDASALRFGGR